MTNHQHISRIIPLYLVLFFGFAGYSLMITLFTPMILHGHVFGDLAATTASKTMYLGVLLSLYPLGQFFGSPIVGALSDHYGRKKLLIISLLLSSFFFTLIALSLVWANFSLLLSALFLAGLSESNIVIAQSAIADITSAENRMRRFGYMNLSISLAYVLSPLIGGQIASHFSYSTPFWVVIIFLLLVTVYTAVNFKETLQTTSHETIHYFDAITNIFSIFKFKSIRYLFFINFICYLSIFGFFRCFPMYLVDEFKMQVGQVSVFIAWTAVPIIIVNVGLISFLSKRIQTRKLMIYSTILTGIFMIFLVIPPSENALWITVFLVSMPLAITLPASATLLSNSVDKTIQGQIMGSNQSLAVLAESLSSLFGASLAAVFFQLPLIVLGILSFIGALLLYRSNFERTAA